MTVRRLLPPLLALVLGLLAAFATSCGSDDNDKKLIPASRAENIREELDKIGERVERGECDALRFAFDRLAREVEGLPRTVDRRLRTRLAEGVAHLQGIAPEECQSNEPETTPETTPETEPETEPETVPPETTPETVPPETTPETVPPETVPPETTTVPPDGGGAEAP